MWVWFIDNSVWILICASLVVLLLLFFNERTRNFLAGLVPEKFRERFLTNVTIIFWTIEGIGIVVMILAFMALALAVEGTREFALPEMVKNWFLGHGLKIVVILLVGIVLWIILKQTLPPLINRVMGRPQRGESREGVKKRANTLQGVISQTLFRRIDQPGMVPCCEVLLCTSAVRNCIRENRIYEIPNIIETSRRLGMQSMDYSIQEHFQAGFIDREEAIIRSSNPGKMEKTLPPKPMPTAGKTEKTEKAEKVKAGS